MSMKGTMLMLMATMAMVGGNSMPSYSPPRRKSNPNPTPRNLSPEELDKLKADRLFNLATAIVNQNAEMGERFKGWKVYKVNEYCIVSSNIKNARKTFIRLMKENNLTEGDF
jgi:ribosomal protein L16 Arg81 hydroxylase